MFVALFKHQPHCFRIRVLPSIEAAYVYVEETSSRVFLTLTFWLYSEPGVTTGIMKWNASVATRRVVTLNLFNDVAKEPFNYSCPKSLYFDLIE